MASTPSWLTPPRTGIFQIFDHLNATLRHPELGRMTAGLLEDRVTSLVKLWELWSLFPVPFLRGLEAAFLRRASDLEGDTLLILQGISDPTSQLDLAALQRQAKLNGIWFDDKADDAIRLFKKIAAAEGAE